MIQYIIKRILKMIPILFFISLIVFILVNSAPGDFVDAKANPNMSAAKVEQLKEIYGDVYKRQAIGGNPHKR